MRRPVAVLTAMILAITCTCSAGAYAFTCYQLFDRSDSVVYRGTLPPVDMSSDGDPLREALRARGQYLMFVEFEKCPDIEFRFGEPGSRDLSIENLIGGLTPMSRATEGAPAAPTPATRPRR